MSETLKNLMTIVNDLFRNYIYLEIIKTSSKNKSFKNADTVILCPIYPAGERKDKKYDELKFARSIAKLSKVNVVIVDDKKQILRYLSRNIYSDEIIIGMGAGSISQWIRDLKNKL